MKDGDLYEIISTYWDRVRDKFKTRAVKISNPGEDIEHEEDDVIYSVEWTCDIHVHPIERPVGSYVPLHRNLCSVVVLLPP